MRFAVDKKNGCCRIEDRFHREIKNDRAQGTASVFLELLIAAMNKSLDTHLKAENWTGLGSLEHQM